MATLWKSKRVCMPINMALVKYWGKRDEELMLPLNDSLSVTIDALLADTLASVFLAPADDTGSLSDSVILNEQPVELSKKPRFPRFFAKLRQLIKEKNQALPGKHFFFTAESVTNFPVSAGLASSAAGFAALAFAFGHIFGFTMDDMCALARYGSGSACRSLLGGLVRWRQNDGACLSLAPSSHWPGLVAIICVLSSAPKSVASSDAMALSQKTSALLKARVLEVHSTAERLAAAFLARDFSTLAELIMRDSNQLHAICMDTYPPLLYLNDSSRRLIEFVHALNATFGAARLAYTFDAGANCCLLLDAKFLGAALATLCHYFAPPPDEEQFIRGHLNLAPSLSSAQAVDLGSTFEPQPGIIDYLVISTTGGGPRSAD